MHLKILFYLFFLYNPKTIYSFYDFYGDVPFQYNIKFTGNLIIASEFLNYTNDGEFTITYALQSRSEFSTGKQMITDWYFSDLKTTTFPSVISTLWQGYLKKKQEEIAYIVRLNNDNFLVFDKQGKLHPISYIMEIFFPIIDMEKPLYQQQYHIPRGNSNIGDKRFLNIRIKGWDFFKYNRPLTDEPLILLETNTQFINEIYTNYTHKRQNKQPTIFWLQSVEATQQNVFKQINSDVNITGMYFIDVESKLLSHATIMGKIESEIPYQYQNYQEPLKIKLEGKFNIESTYPIINGSSNQQFEEFNIDNFMNIFTSKTN